MSVAAQAGFVAALAEAAEDAGATNTYADVAPSGAAAPYVVYTPPANTGPHDDTYGGSYIEDDVFLVSSVAATRLAAEELNDCIGEVLHRARPAGIISVRRENRVPAPPRQPDQVRFVVQTYYRVRYTQGG